MKKRKINTVRGLFLRWYSNHDVLTKKPINTHTVWEETSRKMKCTSVGTMILQKFISQTIDFCKKINVLTTFFGEMMIRSFFLIKIHKTEMRESLNEVCEGVAGVKTYTKESCRPQAYFASKMTLLFGFDQMVLKKPRSSIFT